MNNLMIPVEVIAHFDTAGKITPYRIRYENEGIEIIQISTLLKRSINTFAGNQVEIFECSAIQERTEYIIILNFEKKLNKWFLTKL